jgi:O-antigen/teichoic acid export membrane protein
VRKYLKNPTVKNFQKLLFGNLAIQIVNFAFYPLITRIYSPAEMGEFGAMMSMVQILAVFTTGQYYFAIVGEKDESKIDRIITSSLLLNVFFVAILFCCTFVFDLPHLVPLVVLFYNVSEIFKLRSYRLGKLNQANLSTFFNRLSSQIFKLIGGVTKFPSLLLLSEVAGNLAGMTNYLRDRINFSTKDFFATLKEYRRFPFHYLPNSLAGIVFQELPVLFFATKFSPTLAGHYFLFQKVLAQPIVLMGNIIASSSIKISAEKSSRQETTDYLKKITVKVSFLFIPVALLSFFFGEPLFSFFLGAKYAGAGKIASLLFFVIPFKALKGMSIVSTLHTQRLNLFAAIKLIGLIILGCLIYSYESREFEVFLIYYSIIEIAFDFITLKVALSEEKR